MALLEDGQRPLAEATLNQAMQRFPRESMLKVVLAQFYQQTGRSEQSAYELEALARVRPEGAALLLLAGERDLAAGENLQARLLAKRLRDQYPDDAFAVTGAIALFKLLDDPADAQMVLTRTLGPNIAAPLTRADVLLEAARLAVDDNQLDEARAALSEILLENPSCRPAYQFLGKLYVQQAEWGNALAVYRAACGHWPDDAEFTLALARTARQAGNLADAQAAYRVASALPAVAAEAWLELGAVAQQLGDLAQARHAWQQAAMLPAGKLRATWLLLQTGDDTPAARLATLATLRASRQAEDAARKSRWREELSRRNLTATDDELHALLLLAPDLLDQAVGLPPG
jgi:tetratricopeptide (TPR) repeat protein